METEQTTIETSEGFQQQKVKAAKAAIARGLTRGQFIREQTRWLEAALTLISQLYSNAYSEAMRELEQEKRT